MITQQLHRKFSINNGRANATNNNIKSKELGDAKTQLLKLGWKLDVRNQGHFFTNYAIFKAGQYSINNRYELVVRKLLRPYKGHHYHVRLVYTPYCDDVKFIGYIDSIDELLPVLHAVNEKLVSGSTHNKN